MSTDDLVDRDSYKAREAATCVYAGLDVVTFAEHSIRETYKKYGDNASFKTRITELGLDQWLSRFLERPELLRKEKTE